MSCYGLGRLKPNDLAYCRKWFPYGQIGLCDSKTDCSNLANIVDLHYEVCPEFNFLAAVCSNTWFESLSLGRFFLAQSDTPLRSAHSYSTYRLIP